VSADFESCLNELQVQNDTMMSELETAKSQAVSFAQERQVLTSKLAGLLAQIDSKLADPSTPAATVSKLTALKQAATAEASSPAPTPAAPTMAARVAAAAPATLSKSSSSYPAPVAKKGKKGKLFFPLPYPDFSIGECYAY